MTEDARSAKRNQKTRRATRAKDAFHFFARVRDGPPPHAFPLSTRAAASTRLFRREDHPLHTPRLPVLLQNLRERLRRRARGRRVQRRRPRPPPPHPRPAPVSRPTNIRGAASAIRAHDPDDGPDPSDPDDGPDPSASESDAANVSNASRSGASSPALARHLPNGDDRGRRTVLSPPRRRTPPPIAARFPSGASHSRVEASRRGTSASTPSLGGFLRRSASSAGDHPPGRRTTRRQTLHATPSPDVSTPILPRARTTRKGPIARRRGRRDVRRERKSKRRR